MLVHIGYHKTGTSWLQRLYFPGHPDLQVVGDHEFVSPLIIEPDGLDFDATSARRSFEPRLESARANGKLPVISAERLSGNPHSGGYDSKAIADRIHEMFPEAKVLIVVRRQLDMAVSMYKQYVRMGGVCTIREYLLPPRDGRIPLFRLAFLEYHRLAGYYEKLFGSGKVRVLVYENLLAHPQAFVDDIADFAGIRGGLHFPVEDRVNASLSDFAARLKRRVNCWHGGDSLYPVTPALPRVTGALFDAIDWLDGTGLLGRFPGDLTSVAAPILRGRYAESNRTLAMRFGRDLARYRYEL